MSHEGDGGANPPEASPPQANPPKANPFEEAYAQSASVLEGQQARLAASQATRRLAAQKRSVHLQEARAVAARYLKAPSEGLRQHLLEHLEQLEASAPTEVHPLELLQHADLPPEHLQLARRFLEEQAPLDWQTQRREAPERAWIIPDWLPEGRVCLFSGEGGSGKSRLALQLALAVADPSRHPWIAGSTLQAEMHPHTQTIYATWEDEHDEIDRRLRSLTRDLPEHEAELLREAICSVDLSGRGALYGPQLGAHTSTVATFRPLWRQLTRLCLERHARLLVIDALASAFGSNENDRSLVRGFMAALDHWARQKRIAVLLIAHPSKSEQGRFSGSTDWVNAARVSWVLERKALPDAATPSTRQPASDEDKALCLTLWKGNYRSFEQARPAHFLQWHEGSFVLHDEDPQIEAEANPYRGRTR